MFLKFSLNNIISYIHMERIANRSSVPAIGPELITVGGAPDRARGEIEQE